MRAPGQRTEGSASYNAAIAGPAGGRHYAFFSRGTPTDVFDVTDPRAPVFVRTLPDTCIGTGGIVTWTDHTRLRVGDDEVAALACSGELRLHTIAALAAGAPPAATFTAPEGRFYSVATDGTRIFALSTVRVDTVEAYRATLSIFAPAAPGSVSSYTATTYPIGTFGPGVITYHDGVVYVGDDRRNFGYYRITDSGPVAVPHNDFLMRYYGNELPGYAAPAGYNGTFGGAVADTYMGRLYLSYSHFGLGDLYELDPTFGVVTPPPAMDAGAGDAGALDASVPAGDASTRAPDARGDAGADAGPGRSMGGCGCTAPAGGAAGSALAGIAVGIAMALAGRRREKSV